VYIFQIPAFTSFPLDDYLNHTELNLTENKLASFKMERKTGSESITHLLLAFNKIIEMDVTVLSKDLAVLELNNNSLTTLGPENFDWLKKNSSSLKSLTLTGNPWECACYTWDFVEWVITKMNESTVSNVAIL